MENIKLKLQALIADLPNYRAIQDILKNETIEIHKSQQAKSEFLEVHEIRLKHNNENGTIVPGLKQLVENLQNTDEKVVSIHVIQNSKYAFAIYTDEACSKIFGIV